MIRLRHNCIVALAALPREFRQRGQQCGGSVERSAGPREVSATECAGCHVAFEGCTFEGASCPFCGFPLGGNPDRLQPAPPKVQDEGGLERLLWKSLAQYAPSAGALGGFMTESVPVAVKVPMRRVSFDVQSRRGVLASDADRARHELEICLGKGVPEYLAKALETSGRGFGSPKAMPTVALRVQSEDESAVSLRIVARVEQDRQREQVVGSADIERALPGRREDYDWTLWVGHCSAPFGDLRIAVDAASGRLLAESWVPRVPRRLGIILQNIGEALLILVAAPLALAWQDSLRRVPGLLPLLLAFAGIWAFGSVAQHRQALRDLHRAAGLGDLATVHDLRRQLQRRRRGLGVCALVVLFGALVTGYVRGIRPFQSLDPIPNVPRSERGIDAETLRPWTSINTNFLQSPFGVNGTVYVVTEPAPKVSPMLIKALPSANFSVGRVLSVGAGGYESLAEAVAASRAGDRIRVRPGRHPGGRMVVTHDLMIEGDPGGVVAWSGGQGPFIEVGGAEVRLVLRSIRLEAVGINSNVIGDPNPAYGRPPVGFHPHLDLEDAYVLSFGGGSIYFDSPDSVIRLKGSRVGSISLANAALLQVDNLVTGGQTILGGPSAESLHSGVARGVCVICLRDIEVATLENLTILQEEGELLVANSAGRIVVGPGIRNLRTRLVRAEARELGVLPLPFDHRFEFRVVNGVAEF